MNDDPAKICSTQLFLFRQFGIENQPTHCEKQANDAHYIVPGILLQREEVMKGLDRLSGVNPF